MIHANKVLVYVVAFALASPLVANAGLLVDHWPSVYFGTVSDTEYTNNLGNLRWQQVADNFRLPIDTHIRHVRWWGFYGAFGHPTYPPAGDEVMRIRFYKARAGDGLPGDLWYEENVLNAQRLATGRNVQVGNDVPEYQYDVNLAMSVPIEANTTYWLETVQVGLPSSVFRWSYSDPRFDDFAIFNLNVTDWATIPADLAFQMWDVPEPSSTAALLAVAVIWRIRPHRKEAR